MKKVNINNEKEFFDIYGISMQERWEGFSHEIQTQGMLSFEKYIENESVENLDFKPEDILRIIIGYRGRYSLALIMDNALPTASVIIWEPDEAAFLAGCVCEDISDFITDSRIRIIFGRGDDSGLEDVLRNVVREYNLNHRNIIGYGRYLEPDNEDIVFFREKFRRIAGEVSYFGNARRRYHQLPSENILYALHILNGNSTIEQLFDCVPIRDIPVIIVAAGPSLGKNCMELSKAKGKAIIVAVTHAMKTLNRMNVVPDLVAATDAMSADHMDFDTRNEYTLLSSVFAAKDCQDKYNGHIVFHGFGIYDGTYSPKRTNWKLDAQLDTGSVATDVFSMFLKAGFKTFIVIGQDLAYDKDGYTHTDNEIDDYPEEIQDESKWIESIDGEKVRTRNDWIHFKHFYENMICTHEDICFIDATEGGALIHGSVVMPLREAISKYCTKEYPLSDWIEGIGRGNEGELEEINAWFEEIEINCKDTERLLDEAILLNKSICEKWNDSELWDDEFRASCRRYDILYNIIINGERSILLRFFCSTIIQQYIEDALVLEGDKNIEKRMKMECKLMTMMQSKANELLEYIRSLRKND